PLPARAAHVAVVLTPRIGPPVPARLDRYRPLATTTGPSMLGRGSDPHIVPGGCHESLHGLALGGRYGVARGGCDGRGGAASEGVSEGAATAADAQGVRRQARGHRARQDRDGG